MVYFAKKKFRENFIFAKIMAATINCAKKTFQILCSESFGLLVLLYNKFIIPLPYFCSQTFLIFSPENFAFFAIQIKAKFREKKRNLRNFRERTKCEIFAKRFTLFAGNPSPYGKKLNMQVRAFKNYKWNIAKSQKSKGQVDTVLKIDALLF